VTLVPVQAALSAAAIRSASLGVAGRVAPDGTFVVDGIVPGRYRISFAMPGLRSHPAAPGGGWALRSAAIGAADLADAPFDVGPAGQITGVVVTLSDHLAELVGSLTDAADRPAPGFPIVVFSADRADWWVGSRRVAVARPATDGTFRLFGLPAGRYHLAAGVDLVPADLDDPAFYDALLPGALTVTLVEGARTVQNLRLAP
jgi:hypothetical protein